MNESLKSLWARVYKRPIDYYLLAKFCIILVLLPIHAFLTNWISSNTGGRALVKSWKEVMLMLTIPFIGIILVRHHKIAKRLVSRRVNQIIVVYSILHLLMLVIMQPDIDSALAGVAFNLRFLGMFILAQVLVEVFSHKKLKKFALPIVVAGAVVVGVFGTLQMTILPIDFLNHFGYAQDHPVFPEPYYTIDSNEDFVRITATARGPNPLGAYMAVSFLIIVGWILAKKKAVEWYHYVLLVPVGITLYGSFSRSAWVGLAAGLFFAAVIWGLSHPKLQKPVKISLITAALLLPITFLLIKDTQYFQYTILHNDPNRGPAVTSDSERLVSYEQGIKDVLEAPFGSGPGTGGTASFRNDEGTKLSENYYIQIGREVGVIGVILFLSMVVLVSANLWKQRSDPIVLALLAGLVCMSAISMFLHGWQDETVSMTWWGLAGLYFK